ncbi:MAG: peptidyl-prolyl cis-trans isomerase [Clostridia bacterium]|nr:peptidyl-prolyl cis-trans isomerase [Clostridia bacterium]
MKIRTFEENRKLFIKKIIAVIGLLLIVAILVVGIIFAVNKQKEKEYLESYGMTAVTVGDYEITYDLYRSLYLNHRDDLIAAHTKDGVTDTKALDSAIRTSVLNDARYIYAIISLASENGLSIESADVKAVADTYIEEMKAYCSDNGESYEKMLEDGYITEPAFEFLQKVIALEKVLFTSLKASGEIKSDDTEVLEIINGNDFARVKIIFIGENGKSAEANRAEAQRALEEYNGGESFDSLIGLYSKEVPAEAYVIRGEREAVIESAIFALKDGEVSEVIEGEKGFYVILRLEKDAEYITSHFNDLKEKYQSIELQNKIKARSNTLTATESEYVRALAYEEIK